MYSTNRSHMSASNLDLTRPMEGVVDKPSGQLVNDEVVVTQQGRTRVKDESPFNTATANQEMERHLRRNRKAAPVKFLVDRMRFTKRGYHKYLPYRNIDHFYQPENQPNVFVLYTRDHKGRRSYETYKCASPQDVEKVKQLIDHAGNDRQKLLNESEYHYYPSSRHSSRASTASSDYYYSGGPYGRLSRASSVASIPVQPAPYEKVYYQPVEERPRVVYETRRVRPVSAEPRSEYRQIQPTRSSFVYIPKTEPAVSTRPYVQSRQSYTPVRSSYTPNRQSFHNDDVTYIRSDNVKGTQIMDNGPVYMYVSRQNPSFTSDSPTYIYR